MPFRNEAWAWIKTAPLPVVLALGIVSNGALATWIFAIEANQQNKMNAIVLESKDQKTLIALAKKDAEDASKRTARIEDKLDALIESIAEMRANQRAYRAKRGVN